MHRVALGLLLVATAGCSSPAAQSDPPETGKFSTIYPALFPMLTAAKCDSCHSQPPSNVSNGQLQVGADGDQHAAYETLISGTSTSRFCADAPFIVPGDPEASLFYTKVTEHPPCGERMPLGGGPLPAAQVEMIRSWIAAGALDD